MLLTKERTAFKVRTIRTAKEGMKEVYGISLPRSVAEQLKGIYLHIQVQPNTIILTSGANPRHHE